MDGAWIGVACLAIAQVGPSSGPPLEAPALLAPPVIVESETAPSALPGSPISASPFDTTIPDTTVPGGALPGEAPTGSIGYEQATLDQLQVTLRQLAVSLLPHRYVDEKDWGKTDQRVDGVELSFYRGKFETRRKWKTVNHGTWKRYEIDLVDPENRLTANVSDLRLDERGTPRFRISLRAPLQARGQAAQWIKGVQLFSIGAEASAEVELVVDGSCRIVPAFTSFGPTLRLDPHVDAAAVTLHEFHLDRVGSADGDFAEELGEALESIVRREVESSGDRVAAKINAAIEKRRDRLVLSLPEFQKSTWGDWLLDRVPGLDDVAEPDTASVPVEE